MRPSAEEILSTELIKSLTHKNEIHEILLTEAEDDEAKEETEMSSPSFTEWLPL